MESVLGADATIQSLCEDIVAHYEKYRANLLTGKAMIVAYSRAIAIKIYRKLLELRPTWEEKIGVVMTGGNNDPEDWKKIVGTKAYKEELAIKFSLFEPAILEEIAKMKEKNIAVEILKKLMAEQVSL